MGNGVTVGPGVLVGIGVGVGESVIVAEGFGAAEDVVLCSPELLMQEVSMRQSAITEMNGKAFLTLIPTRGRDKPTESVSGGADGQGCLT